MNIRLKYALITAIVVLFGLSTRKLDFYPEFVQEHFGDALWAAMVYFGLSLVFPYKKAWRVSLAALLFSYSIEISQLYQAEWINKIRDTTLGALVLGNGLLVYDFVRYTAGVLFAFIIDKFLFKKII